MHKTDLNGQGGAIQRPVPDRPSEGGHVFDGSYGQPLYVIWRVTKAMRREIGPMLRQWRNLKGAGPLWHGLSARIGAAARLMFPLGPWRQVVAELRNRFEVYFLVSEVAYLTGIKPQWPFPLDEVVTRTLSLPAYQTLWALEGTGFDYSRGALKAGSLAQPLFEVPIFERLPQRAWLMLQIGMGLGFAFTLLDKVEKENPDIFPQRMQRVVGLCRTHAVNEQYAMVSLESLGFAVGLYHSGLIGRADAWLVGKHPELRDGFWCGVGRSQLFTPLNFLPGSYGRAFSELERLAPDEHTRLRAFTGLAFAVITINVRHPKILDRLWIRPHAELLLRNRGWVNGMIGAALLRWETSPGFGPFEVLAEHGSHLSSTRQKEVWRQLVTDPIEQARSEIFPGVSKSGNWGEILIQARYGSSTNA